MEQGNISARYQQAWKDIEATLTAALASLGRAVVAEHPHIHDLVRHTYWIPHDRLGRLCGADSNRGEAKRGSGTGLFFELLLTSIIASVATSRLADVEIERNRCPPGRFLHDHQHPDLFIARREKSVAFEFKATFERQRLPRRTLRTYGLVELRSALLSRHRSQHVARDPRYTQRATVGNGDRYRG